MNRQVQYRLGKHTFCLFPLRRNSKRAPGQHRGADGSVGKYRSPTFGVGVGAGSTKVVSGNPPLTPPPHKFLTIQRAKELHKTLCLPLPFAFDLHQDVSWNLMGHPYHKDKLPSEKKIINIPPSRLSGFPSLHPLPSRHSRAQRV